MPFDDALLMYEPIILPQRRLEGTNDHRVAAAWDRPRALQGCAGTISTTLESDISAHGLWNMLSIYAPITIGFWQSRLAIFQAFTAPSSKWAPESWFLRPGL